MFTTDLRKFFIEKYGLVNWLDQAKKQYHSADPFPHIVIDDFLPVEILDAVLEDFPDPKQKTWQLFQTVHENKLGTKKEHLLPQTARSVCAELNSGYVLDWLEYLTDVKGLVADTRLIGGGLHQIESGGKLGIHIDFNIEPTTGLARKLNLLLYLNQHWDDQWGGHLELWNADKTKCVKKISPLFNRCVIFNTTGKSWHGHPYPLATPEGITRKSLALYYYANDPTVKQPHDTIFQERTHVSK
jgi:Rps23 Pro-64 3,4-dihydroxylase Tpa1-like proline 4-hydroxylase